MKRKKTSELHRPIPALTGGANGLVGNRPENEYLTSNSAKCWGARRDQCARIEEKRGGKAPRKECSEKPPLKGETFRWKMRRRQLTQA